MRGGGALVRRVTSSVYFSSLPSLPSFSAVAVCRTSPLSSSTSTSTSAEKDKRLSLVYETHGEPDQVLRLRKLPVKPTLGEGELRVRVIAASINPADINTVQGVYPLKPRKRIEGQGEGQGEGETSYAVGGSEGVGVVVEERSGNTKVGDVVVPVVANLGTWSEEFVCDQDDIQVVSVASKCNRSNSEVEKLANVSVCWSTAYRMLEDFVKLERGDYVIQNGANSAVGQAVIQLAKRRGLRSVNLIRDSEETKQYLRSIGADVVTTLDKLKQDCQGIPPPKVGFNCIGGEFSQAISKRLAFGGTLVTYGGMSKQPVSIPTPLQIFKDVSAKGFWLSGSWYPNSTFLQRKRMVDEIAQGILEGSLSLNTVRLPLSQAMTAFQHKGLMAKGKIVLTMQN